MAIDRVPGRREESRVPDRVRRIQMRQLTRGAGIGRGGRNAHLGALPASVFSERGGWYWWFAALFLRLLSGIGVFNLPLLLCGGWAVVRRPVPAARFLLLWIASVCTPLVLTLPGPRYFLPAVPALAIRRARGLEGAPHGRDRIVLPALAFGGGMLYLFVDWYRAAGGLSFLTWL